jgi:hypothetical protein
MTGSTGSESWGRSDVGEAVGINLVMHSVAGPGGQHDHVDRAAGPLARGYYALHQQTQYLLFHIISLEII